MSNIQHRRCSVDGVDLFYRIAGRAGSPVMLLLHGFPSSSFQYRHMLSALSDRWQLVAPDLPGFGFSAITQPYTYTFDRLADTIAQWIESLDLIISAAYLHDYGGHVGFRLLTRGSFRPKALIIQNTEAYRGEGWHEPMRGIETRQKEPPEQGRARLKETLINEAGIRKEFYEDLPSDIAERIDPAAFQLGWNKICSPGILDAMLDLHMDYGSNIRNYRPLQSYLVNEHPPTLLLWGERDQYLSMEAARAYQRDIPDAEIVQFDGGHWLLESHADEVNTAVRRFLSARI